MAAPTARPKNGMKKIKPNSMPQKCAAQSASIATHADHLLGLGFFLALRPGNCRSVYDGEQLLFLQALNLSQSLFRALRGWELPNS